MADPRIGPVGANLEAFVAAAADTPLLRRAGVRDAVVYTSDVPFPVFNMVSGAAFRPETVSERTGELFLPALDPGLFVHLLAWDDDVPVGCGTVFFHDGTAGIDNIAVLERYRGRGIGYAVTAALMDLGVAAGCTNAVLNASEMGRPTYERLGFEEVCLTPQWIWMPPEEISGS